MAEFQLVVPYKPMRTKLALVGVVAILPVWSLIAPITLGFFIVYVLRGPDSCPPLVTAIICLTLLAIWIFGAILSAVSEDTKIHVTKNGISFPPFLLPQLKFKRNWHWTSLKAATIVDGQKGKTLLLTFEPDTTLKLTVSDFKQSQLEEFLLAVELWGKNCERSAELIEYQRENQSKVIGQQGHTKMWQEELSRRFTATTFVPLEPGRKLQNGRLKVVRQLAFGGLSAIYLVQKNETEAFVLKEAVVPPNADSQARLSAEQHLAREAQMLFCLYHPNIARVVDHFVEDNRHYLLMEYIHGQDLRQLVKQNGPLQESQVLRWARVIADILNFLHSQNPPVIHRDLTPDNLVLKNDGSIYLIDFGASNEFIGTATGTLVGKQAYIAPEQLRGKTVPQSDLYALGGTLYFLLTGRDPVPLARTDLKNSLPSASDDVCQLISLLTAFDRKERMLTAADLLAYLDGLIAGREQDTVASTASGVEQ